MNEAANFSALGEVVLYRRETNDNKSTNKRAVSGANIATQVRTKANQRERRWCHFEERKDSDRGTFGHRPRDTGFVAKVVISRTPGRFLCAENVLHLAAGTRRCLCHPFAVSVFIRLLNTDAIGRDLSLSQ